MGLFGKKKKGSNNSLIPNNSGGDVNLNSDRSLNIIPSSSSSMVVNSRRSLVSSNGSPNSSHSSMIVVDPSSVDNFEEWLEADPRFGSQKFELKRYRDSDMKKLIIEGLKKSTLDRELIPKLIKNDSGLLRLDFIDCKFCPETAHTVLEALVYNKTLQVICFSFNRIDHLASTSIKEVLTHNNSLKAMDLKNNTIGDSGCIAIMNALETNDSLTDLDLRRNNITGEACQAIKKALLANNTLQKLELRGNCVGSDGCRLIIEGLYNNTSISTLTLERNNIDADLNKKCMSLVARNDTIRRHRKGIEDKGISFYISIERKDGKPYLTWARDDNSNTIVDEAAKSNSSLAIIVFIDTLRRIIDPVNDNTSLSDSSLSDSVSASIEDMLQDRKILRKLVNQKINDDTYIVHMVAKSEHSTSLKFLKFLVNRCDASFYTAMDSKGFCARAIALGSKDTEKHEWAKTHGSFLGKYIIEGGKGIHSNPVHKSSTSIVHFARDVTIAETDPKYHVAIKIMSDKESYEREIKVRLKSHILYTINSGEDIPESSNRYSANAIGAFYRYHDEIDAKGQRYQCLVFEKMGKNLHRIIESEKIGGRDERRVLFYGKTLGKAVQLMHSSGYIHADLKTRNTIRATGNIMKIIDLDSTVAKGERLTGQFSSAFISPEIARARFGSTDADKNAFQKKIIKNQKALATLNLTEETEIDKYYKLNEKIQALLVRRFSTKNNEDSLLADESVDIWGFGVIMYFLCTSKPLFWYDLGDNLANDSEKNRLLTWQGLSRENLDNVIPPFLSPRFRENSITFLMKCLHADPTKRFLSMEEILDHALFYDVDDD